MNKKCNKSASYKDFPIFFGSTRSVNNPFVHIWDHKQALKIQKRINRIQKKGLMMPSSVKQMFGLIISKLPTPTSTPTTRRSQILKLNRRSSLSISKLPTPSPTP